jgi:predicted RNA-binding Zn-ribbon protein involved in translation (DUF1610 family)
MSDGTEIYGIEADVWATMGWEARFRCADDTCDELLEKIAELRTELHAAGDGDTWKATCQRVEEELESTRAQLSEALAAHHCPACGGVRVRESELCSCSESAEVVVVNSYWWCPTCTREIDGRRVSFWELCDVCGSAVKIVECGDTEMDLKSHVSEAWVRDIRAWLETQPGATEFDGSPLDGVQRVMRYKDERIAELEQQVRELMTEITAAKFYLERAAEAGGEHGSE